jgi:hypothetical protein
MAKIVFSTPQEAYAGLAEGDLVLDAQGQLSCISRGVPGDEAPDTVWFQWWSDEYASVVEADGSQYDGGPKLQFPLTKVKVVPVDDTPALKHDYLFSYMVDLDNSATSFGFVTVTVDEIPTVAAVHQWHGRLADQLGVADKDKLVILGISKLASHE